MTFADFSHFHQPDVAIGAVAVVIFVAADVAAIVSAADVCDGVFVVAAAAVIVLVAVFLINDR